MSEQQAAPAAPDINKLLTVVVEKGASDLFLTAGIPPSLKLHGKVVPITNTPLTPEKTREVVMSLMNEKQRTLKIFPDGMQTKTHAAECNRMENDSSSFHQGLSSVP